MKSCVSKGSWALCMYCFVLLSLSLVSTIYFLARNNKNNDQFCWSVVFCIFLLVYSANKPSSDSEANNIYINYVVVKQYITMFSNLGNPKFTNVCKMLMMSTILEFIKWLVTWRGQRRVRGVVWKGGNEPKVRVIHTNPDFRMGKSWWSPFFKTKEEISVILER